MVGPYEGTMAEGGAVNVLYDLDKYVLLPSSFVDMKNVNAHC